LSGSLAHQDSSLPQVFGRYLLVQRLSRGGMGEIFLAKHGLAGFEKLAVIKKVLPHLAADEQFISRFVDEAQVAIKLSHVNVAQVFEVGRVGDEYFLALEYVDGRDLRRTLGLLNHRNQRLPVDLALFVARELANGLAYAHRRTTSDGESLNLVHCDISPPNVLVSFEGETKVIDFGIAKSAMRGTATDPKMGFGKFGYMAPEQLLRGGVVDHRTDLYAAGVVLYELLTGSRLYEAGPEPDYRALARKVTRGEHPLPSDIDPVLAPYDNLVATALRPKPEHRYQSAAELRDAIQQCLVAVNPTISTDQLGAFMRALFADEMTAQRELHMRVASAHLSDFQDQFHTQKTSTVSFALAQLPVQAPEATGRVPRRGYSTPPSGARARGAASLPPGDRPTSPSPAIKPSPAFDTMAPPTGPLDPVDDSSAAPRVATGAVQHRSVRRRAVVIATTAALALAAGVALWALVARTGDARSQALAQLEVQPPGPRAITVEPIPVEPGPAEPSPSSAAPGGGDGEAKQPVSTQRGEATEPSTQAAKEAKPSGLPAISPPVSRHVSREPVHRQPHKDLKAAPVPPASFTREQLGQKFQQIRREYDDYKAKFGSRLEREWGELATFIQYMPASDDDAGRKEAARRLDAFRTRMRE
jgi:serine/threonine protein kinase